MNLYFRFIRILIMSIFAPVNGLLDASRLKFINWPWDCDLNMHMTNSRYFSMMDLGRVFLMKQLGIMTKTFKRKWFPVVHSIEISFLTPIPPMRRFVVHTRLITWDEKYVYIEVRFESKGKLHAVAFVRGLFVGGKKPIPSSELLKLTGDDSVEPPPVPEVIKRWQTLLKDKKAHLEN